MAKAYETNIEGSLVIDISLPEDEKENTIVYIPAKEIEAYSIDEYQDLPEVGQIKFKEGQIPSVLVDEESIEEEEAPLNRTEDRQAPFSNIAVNSKANEHENVVESKNKTHIEYDVSNMILETYQLKCLKGDLYLYKEIKGCFFQLDDHQVRTLVRCGWPDKIQRLLSKGRVDDIIDRLRTNEGIQIKEDDLDKYSHLINFNDCVLNLKTKKILNHSPHYSFTNFINANYENQQPEGNHFLNFINQCTEGDNE